jgi:hypothetical protein
VSERTEEDLNSEVTFHIYRAETALRTAIDAWEDVERCEEKLVLKAVAIDDQMTASRGIGAARERINVLKALLGKD